MRFCDRILGLVYRELTIARRRATGWLDAATLKRAAGDAAPPMPPPDVTAEAVARCLSFRTSWCQCVFCASSARYCARSYLRTASSGEVFLIQLLQLGKSIEKINKYYLCMFYFK